MEKFILPLKKLQNKPTNSLQFFKFNNLFFKPPPAGLKKKACLYENAGRTPLINRSRKPLNPTTPYAQRKASDLPLITLLLLGNVINGAKIIFFLLFKQKKQ